MKSVLSLLFIFLITFSCKKASFPGIVGSWYSTAVYREQQSGSFEWIPATDRNRFQYYFSSEGTFSSFSDVPGGHGTYSYNRSSEYLQLNFEADIYGGIAHSDTVKIEKINDNRWIMVHFSNTGIFYSKTEYARWD